MQITERIPIQMSATEYDIFLSANKAEADGAYAEVQIIQDFGEDEKNEIKEIDRKDGII